MAAKLYNECRCIGKPLRFIPGECFTCGRFLPGLAGRLNADEKRELSRPGLGALLEAVERKRIELRTKFPAPRHNHRRVVIEPKVEPSEPARAPAGKKTHGGRRTKPRSKEVREAMSLAVIGY